MTKYQILRWITTKGTYWGDKLLTLLYLILFGLFILAYRFINMVRIKAWNTFLFVTRGIKSHWNAYRLQKRIQHDWLTRGERDYTKELREKEL